MTPVQLVKRYAKDGSKKHWFWLLRWWSRDGTTRYGDVIGWYAPAGDSWRPARSKAPRPTRSQAKAKRDAKILELRQGKGDKPDPTDWTAWVDNYVEETRGTIAIATMSEVEHALRLFGETVSLKSPATVTRTMVKRFVQSQRARNKSAATILKYIAYLKRVWNDKEFTENPFVDRRWRRQLKTAVKDWHRYTSEEICALLRVCPDLIWRVRIYLAYTAALRKGEALNLTWDDIDLKHREVSVAPKVGTSTTWAWAPKDIDRRSVPLTHAALGMLRKLRAKAHPENPYVLISPERHRYLRDRRAIGTWDAAGPQCPRDVANNFLRDFHAMCKRAEVPEDEFHSLRKSCITNWLEAGVPPHEVQAMAGHASIETTIRYYAKVDKSAMARVREASERYAAGISA